jgi:hypothetical protein
VRVSARFPSGDKSRAADAAFFASRNDGLVIARSFLGMPDMGFSAEAANHAAPRLVTLVGALRRLTAKPKITPRLRRLAVEPYPAAYHTPP